jgi:hypothetical protein
VLPEESSLDGNKEWVVGSSENGLCDARLLVRGQTDKLIEIQWTTSSALGVTLSITKPSVV